jgi:hypothetical protein
MMRTLSLRSSRPARMQNPLDDRRRSQRNRISSQNFWRKMMHRDASRRRGSRLAWILFQLHTNLESAINPHDYWRPVHCGDTEEDSMQYIQ